MSNDSTTFKAGQVIQMFEGAWCDAVILGFGKDRLGDTYAKMARPYAYASGVGTTSPSVLMGVENFEMAAKNLKNHRRVENTIFTR